MPDASPSVDQVRRLLDQRRYQEAEKESRVLLLNDPSIRGEALALFGLSLIGLGQAQLGEVFVRRAVTEHPNLAAAHEAMGRVLLQQNRALDAVQALRRARSLDPASSDIHRQLIRALIAANRVGSALLEVYDAQKSAPESLPIPWLLITHLIRLGDVDEARRHYDKIIAQDDRYRSTLSNRAFNLLAAGSRSEARAVLQQSLALDPDNREATQILSALESETAPSQAPDGFVRGLFDSYASRFDAHLTGALRYVSPKLLQRALRRALGEPDGRLAVLDLGCGTGLAGQVLRPYAARLVGVDLSPEMLARARSTDLYDHLVEGEMTRYLDETEERFDLIASTDVLVYVGDWLPVFGAAAHVLRPGGRLAITAERHDGDGYILHQAARYAHSFSYLGSTATAAGLEVEFAEEVIPRWNRGEPVPGLLGMMRLPDEQGG